MKPRPILGFGKVLLERVSASPANETMKAVLDNPPLEACLAETDIVLNAAELAVSIDEFCCASRAALRPLIFNIDYFVYR